MQIFYIKETNIVAKRFKKIVEKLKGYSASKIDPLRVKDILTRRFKRCSRNSVKIFKTQNWKKTYNYLIKKNVIIKISDNNNELIFFVEYSNNCLFRKNLVHPVHAFVTFTDKKLKYPLICTKSVCIYIYMYASRKYISLYIDWIHVVLNISSFLTIQFTKEIFHIYKEYDKRQLGEFFWNLIIKTRGRSSFFIANIKMPFVMNKYISLSSRSIIYFFFIYIDRFIHDHVRTCLNFSTVSLDICVVRIWIFLLTFVYTKLADVLVHVDFFIFALTFVPYVKFSMNICTVLNLQRATCRLTAPE